MAGHRPRGTHADYIPSAWKWRVPFCEQSIGQSCSQSPAWLLRALSMSVLSQSHFPWEVKVSVHFILASNISVEKTNSVPIIWKSNLSLWKFVVLSAQNFSISCLGCVTFSCPSPDPWWTWKLTSWEFCLTFSSMVLPVGPFSGFLDLSCLKIEPLGLIVHSFYFSFLYLFALLLGRDSQLCELQKSLEV